MINRMEREFHSKYNGLKKYYITFFKWVLLSLLIGGLCGGIGALFFHCIAQATQLRQTNPWLIFLLPVSGLLIAFSYSKANLKNDKGTNLVIRSIRSDKSVPLRMVILIFFSTIITHLFGGSAGREGAALQIGGGVGTHIGEKIHLSEHDRSIATMCGMSALFSALFGTPLTATIFSMEVISVGLMHYSALVPCLLSSLLAYKIALYAHVVFETYTLTSYPAETFLTYGKVILLGLIFAFAGVIFCEIMHVTGKLASLYIHNRYLRIVLGGLLLVLLTQLVGNYDYNGAGSHMIARAMEGETEWYAFLLKMIFTVITLSCGFKGGEIVPTFFIGSTLGCTIAPLIGLPASLGAALGLVGMFCAVVNCPIASLLLSVELFGTKGFLLFGIICAVSYMMSGTYSLYSSQKIMYSKLEPEFINRKAR